MSTRDEDFDEAVPLIVDLSDTEYQIRTNLEAYLAGRIDLEKMFARVGPLYEETSSPTAHQVVMLVAAYANGSYLLGELRRAFEEMVSNMKTFH